MALAHSRKVSCGVTVCMPDGAPAAAAARGAALVEAPAERRAPARRPADLRAGALRRATFFEAFFFAMVFLLGKPPEITPGTPRQRRSTIYRLQREERSPSAAPPPERSRTRGHASGTGRESQSLGNRSRRKT